MLCGASRNPDIISFYNQYTTYCVLVKGKLNISWVFKKIGQNEYYDLRSLFTLTTNGTISNYDEVIKEYNIDNELATRDVNNFINKLVEAKLLDI